MAKGIVGRFLGKIFPSRQAPVRETTQAKHVREKMYGGNTKDMAQAYGVKPRTIQRWIKGDRTPKGGAAKKLAEDSALAQTSPRSREKRAEEFRSKKHPKAPSGTSAHVPLTNAKIKDSPLVRAGGSRPPVNFKLTNEQMARLLENGTDQELENMVRAELAGWLDCAPDEIEIDADDVRFL